MADEAQIRQLQRHAAEAFEVFLLADPTVGGRVERVGDATVFRWPVIPVPLFNHAVGLGDERAPRDGEIDTILRWYREESLPCYIQLSPLADQGALGTRLAARGLEEAPAWSILAATPDGWKGCESDSAITIEEVGEDSRDAFVDTLLEAFSMADHSLQKAIAAMVGRPDVVSFLVRYEGEPAGTGQLIARAGVGGLFSGGVVERFRRRRIHGALIQARARAAFDRGMSLLYSETEEVGNQSSRDLQRLGFFEAYRHLNWSMAAKQ